MVKREPRDQWVSDLRVSTAEQAEHDLSLPAQRRAVADYATRHEQVVAYEYLEEGSSGTTMNRKAFRQMLEDVFRPGSTIGTIVVHHTSRFTRNATEARVMKQKLRKEGVRVVSVCQETQDDPIGQLIEGIFECIDQYESEVNGMRTSAAMREAVRQGYFPSAATPYGFGRKKIEIRPNVFRSLLVPDAAEAEIVKLMFQLYVAGNGAKNVANTLNERKLLNRHGAFWTKDLVLHVLDEPAVAGTYIWGRWSTKRGKLRDESEWLTLPCERIVEPALYELAMKLRKEREPTRNPGKPASPANLLAGLVRCGKCGASFQLESSGKKLKSSAYQYRYYNCRTFCRVGSASCGGYRIRTNELDAAVLQHLTSAVCREDRIDVLKSLLPKKFAADTGKAWRSLLTTGGTVSRNYLLLLIDKIIVRENEIEVIPKPEFAAEPENQNKNAPL